MPKFRQGWVRGRTRAAKCRRLLHCRWIADNRSGGWHRPKRLDVDASDEAAVSTLFENAERELGSIEVRGLQLPHWFHDGL